MNAKVLGGVMPAPDYYTLDEAAELLGCSTTRLIHEGSRERLPVYILTSKYFVKATHILADGTIREGSKTSSLAKLAGYCLRQFEAGDNDPAAIIEPEPVPDCFGGGEFRFELRHKNIMYPTIHELNSASMKGIDIDSIYPPPILIKDCLLVILATDLNTLLAPEPKDAPNATANNEHTDDQEDERESQLHILIWRVYQYLVINKQRKTAQSVWNEIQHRYENHDEEKIIQEVTSDVILWVSGYGNELKLMRSSFDKTFSNLKKNPPF